MNPYIENLKSFLADQAPCFGYDDANSLLEMLCYYYTLANPVDSAVIRCQFQSLHNVLHRLPFEEEAIFSLTASLCASHERQVLLEGIHVGARLFTELML